jgi:uncharacterized protein (DUF885 family)
MRPLVLVAFLVSFTGCRPAPTPRQAAPQWVPRSNEHARVLLAVTARFVPEQAAQLGMESVDEQILDLRPRFVERQWQATEEAIAALRKRLADEPHPIVRQDLEILISSAERSVALDRMQEKTELTYPHLARLVFHSMSSLLDDQVPPARRAAAAVRMRRYAGLEAGYRPVAELATDYVRERLRVPNLRGPVKTELERYLADAGPFLAGVGKLAQRFQIAGFAEAYAKVQEQLAAYHEFLRREVLPRCTDDFRLPSELYAARLRKMGIDLAPDALAARARQAFTEIQGEMQALAKKVAADRGLAAGDYREVIRALKARQLAGDAILPHYRARLATIEEIIRRERLVTLPARPARIRLATAAESAAIPAPNMRPPRLIGNRGEQGTFLLPLQVPAPPGAPQSATVGFDDFTFEAASWTLTAHEARPGHEMQFAAMMERGVSMARAVFAFNSTNVEGWGLYAESVLFPFMPADGQLISLQHRLLRAARAFLDPELQAGKITPAEALRVLREDVVLSEPMARQEVERYTFRAPGQALSYFYGYLRLLALRREVAEKLGARFEALRFHDFVLSQGLLPPDLLRQATLQWASAG